MRSADQTAHWSSRAECGLRDPDSLFVQGAAQNEAALICRGCPVWLECLADALDGRVEWGIWGGLTERQRRHLLRQRPRVPSWRELLESTRRQHLAAVPDPVPATAGPAAGGP